MRTEVRGGCLDGAHVREALRPVLRCGRSWWALDDDLGEYVFAGLDGFGREFARIMEKLRMEARAEQAIEEARRPRGCGRCGRTFANAVSYQVHDDPAQGCLPGDAFGQLEQVDGVWQRIGAGR